MSLVLSLGPIFLGFGYVSSPKYRRMLMSQGTDYIFPDPSAISTLIDKGMNFFRVQFMMERLLPDSMTGSYDEEYLANLTTVR